MGQKFGRLSVRPQLPPLPTRNTDDRSTLTSVVGWAEAFQRAVATTMYDNIQKALVFTISNTGNQAVANGVTTQAVTFDGREIDTSYQVALTPNWNTTVWWTAKTVTGFTLNLGTAPGVGGGSVDWIVSR